MSSKSVFKQMLVGLGLFELVLRTATSLTRVKNVAVHFLSEVIYRAPNPFFLLQLSLSSRSREMKKASEDLCKYGIVTLDSFIPKDRLAELQKKFDHIMKNIEEGEPAQMKLTPDGGRLHPQTLYPEAAYDKDARITIDNNPFKDSKEFLQVALDEFILGVIAGYMKKKFMLQQAVATRYYPFEKNNFGSWQWHHDSWGRKVNVMILLTDVTEKDQYMGYMKYSHKIFQSYERTVINDRFTEQEVQSQKSLEEVKCLGKAGTVFIFDANGFHRGNRALGATRDVLINQYTAGRYLWAFDIPEKMAKELDQKQFKFLMQNPHIKLF